MRSRSKEEAAALRESLLPFVLLSEQASHNGDIARAVEEGRLRREEVAELGRVLLGEEDCRRSDEQATVFDSTGLAVQDLAVALAVYERWRANPNLEDFVGVTEIAI